MKVKNRLFVALIALTILGMFLVEVGIAKDDYPSKPIRVIVAFSAGGGNDQSMRLIQPFLEKELGVPVVVENRGGGGSEIANTLLYRAPADGYTLLSNNSSYVAMTTILRTPVYKYEDIVPVVVELIDPRILLVKKDSPYNTLTDIIEAVKKNPGKMAFGVGAGGNQQLLLLSLREALKLDYRIVGYKGGSRSRAAMLGGHVDGAMGEIGGAYYLRDQTKAVCIFYDQPNPLWPEAKPVNEQLKPYGVRTPDLALYRIYWATREFKEKHPDRFATLQKAFLKASKNPEYLKRAEKVGFLKILVWSPAEKYESVLKEQIEFFRKTKHLWKEQ
jgi:tripartite-type tricarboxylate transporter receptor subunit TctC